MTKIDLLFPIKISDKGVESEIKSITLSNLKSKHLKYIPKELYDAEKRNSFRVEKILPLIAAISGLTEEVVDELAVEDLMVIFENLTKSLGEFIPQKTGNS